MFHPSSIALGGKFQTPRGRHSSGPQPPPSAARSVVSLAGASMSFLTDSGTPTARPTWPRYETHRITAPATLSPSRPRPRPRIPSAGEESEFEKRSAARPPPRAPNSPTASLEFSRRSTAVKRKIGEITCIQRFPPLRAAGAKPSELARDGRRRRAVDLLGRRGSRSAPTPAVGSAGGRAGRRRRCPCRGEILSPPRVQPEAEVARPALLQVSPLSCPPQLRAGCSRRSVR
jgi:hypothetical protein